MQLHADLNEVTAEQREKALEEFYRIQLKQAIPEMLKKCTNIVGKSFRGYMDQFYPNWRRVKKILNE